MKEKESLILCRLLKKIAPSIGATVLAEPEWGLVGQVTLKNGKRLYFRYNSLDLNPMASAEIARDKDYANFFMSSMGYPIIPCSRTFFSKHWGNVIGVTDRGIHASYLYAKSIGFPVIVKPNSSCQGQGVTMVYNKKELYSAIKAIFVYDKIALVQKPVYGKDYRIVVLDDKIISAYERIPLGIVGDGTSSIEQLLDEKQKLFIASGRDTKIRTADPRIMMKLRRQGLTFESVLAKGQKFYLLDNANLSTGGDSVDVTSKIHPQFKQIAVKLTADMGLRLCGVDIIVVNGDISQAPQEYYCLEVNASPGLDNYAKLGKAQKRIVEDLYLEVIKCLEH